MVSFQFHHQPHHLHLTTLEDGGWFFRTAPSDARQGPVLASIAMSRGQTDMAVTHSKQ